MTTLMSSSLFFGVAFLAAFGCSGIEACVAEDIAAHDINDPNRNDNANDGNKDKSGNNQETRVQFEKQKILSEPAPKPEAETQNESAPQTDHSYTFYTPEDGQRVHVGKVDLASKLVHLRASRPDELALTPSQFDSLVKAKFTINANFFNTKVFDVLGLAMGDGVVWKNRWDTVPVLACSKSNSCVIHDDVDVPVSTWHNIVAGFPRLLNAGKAITAEEDRRCKNPSICAARHPRTAVGLDASRRFLYLVVVEGRTKEANGMTTSELAAFMGSKLGVADAINLDGGGSSVFMYNSQRMSARPDNEQPERKVANNLSVIVSP